MAAKPSSEPTSSPARCARRISQAPPVPSRTPISVAETSAIQTKTPAEFEENFRQYGAQGYDLVIGHGFEYQDAAVRVAPEFPKTVYVTTSGNQVGPNLAGIEFDGYPGFVARCTGVPSRRERASRS